MSVDKNIVYFDTECLYCNRFVIFLLDNDRNNTFYFSNVTEDISRKLIGSYEDTIIFVEGKNTYLRSKAILMILKRLGGKYKLFASIFDLIPSMITDFFYRIFAKFRHKIPYNKSCRILTEKEKTRFIK